MAMGMLMVMTMLVLSLMQSVRMDLKIQDGFLTFEQSLYQLEFVAQQIVLSNTECWKNTTDFHQLSAWVKSKHGCVIEFNRQRYHYIVSDLGSYPCLIIPSSHRIYGSHHWLVTISSTTPPEIVLQIRTAKARPGLACEFSHQHKINAGLISWHMAS